MLDLSLLGYRVNDGVLREFVYPDYLPFVSVFLSERGLTVYFSYKDVDIAFTLLDWNIRDFFVFLQNDLGVVLNYQEFKDSFLDSYCCSLSYEDICDRLYVYISGVVYNVISFVYDSGLVEDYLADYFKFAFFVLEEDNSCRFFNFGILDYGLFFLESLSDDDLIIDIDRFEEDNLDLKDVKNEEYEILYDDTSKKLDYNLDLFLEEK